MKRTVSIYQLTDRLHDGRTVQVSADEIVGTVAAWLAELSATSPVVVRPLGDPLALVASVARSARRG